jgi:hypothetical protein
MWYVELTWPHNSWYRLFNIEVDRYQNFIRWRSGRQWPIKPRHNNVKLSSSARRTQGTSPGGQLQTAHWETSLCRCKATTVNVTYSFSDLTLKQSKRVWVICWTHISIVTSPLGTTNNNESKKIFRSRFGGNHLSFPKTTDMIPTRVLTEHMYNRLWHSSHRDLVYSIGQERNAKRECDQNTTGVSQ